jgi:hypothetical protein
MLWLALSGSSAWLFIVVADANLMFDSWRYKPGKPVLSVAVSFSLFG